MRRFTPMNCPTCEYDRKFPDFEGGGWLQQDNNGPIVSCPTCNNDGIHPRDAGAGWMFACPKCKADYSIDEWADSCPFCDWSDGNKEPAANWENEK